MTIINDINLEKWRSYENIRTEDLWLIDNRNMVGNNKFNISIVYGKAGDSKFAGNILPEICYQMIQRYTKKGEVVLDPTVGSGTTIDVAKSLERIPLGYDLNPVRDDIKQGNLMTDDYPSCQLIIFHPPYYNVIKYSDHPDDLSNCVDIFQYLVRLKNIIFSLSHSLDVGRYFILVLGRIYYKGQVWDLGSRTATWMQDSLGFKLKGVIAKDFNWTKRNVGLWRYRALRDGTWMFKYDSVYVLQKGK
jgi:hypothetical protein